MKHICQELGGVGDGGWRVAGGGKGGYSGSSTLFYRPVLAEQLHRGGMPAALGLHERGDPVVGLHVDVGARGDEQPQDLRCGREGGRGGLRGTCGAAAPCTRRIRAATGAATGTGRQRLYLDVAAARRAGDGRQPGVRLGVDVSALVEEELFGECREEAKGVERRGLKDRDNSSKWAMGWFGRPHVETSTPRGSIGFGAPGRPSSARRPQRTRARSYPWPARREARPLLIRRRAERPSLPDGRPTPPT
eukprot:scaffold2021_cov121-Isochrysis_galbana.AAC.1